MRRVSARVDPVALGISIAVICGGLMFAATNILVLKGGDEVGPHLGLLGQYLFGYHVTVYGSWIGAMYGAGAGFLFGWSTAHLRNVLLDVRLWLIKLRANLSGTYFLDRVD